MDVLLYIDGLGALLAEDMTVHRRKYILDKLIEIKTDYIDNIRSDHFMRDTVVKELRNEIKAHRKEIRRIWRGDERG